MIKEWQQHKNDNKDYNNNHNENYESNNNDQGDISKYESVSTIIILNTISMIERTIVITIKATKMI